MKIEEALAHWFIQKYEPAAINRQALYRQFLKLWLAKQYEGEELTGVPLYGEPRRVFYHAYKKLDKSNRIQGHVESTKGFAFFTKGQRLNTPEQIVSGIYPFGYLSHLSAMNAYKLGSVKSSAIYFTCLGRMDWHNQSLKDLRSEFKVNVTNYIDLDGSMSRTTSLNGIHVEEQSIIDGYPSADVLEDIGIIIINKKYLDESEWWGGVKVQNIIDLFIDMIRSPQYCGGLQHVIRVYNHHLDIYFEKIVEKLEVSGSIIDRARFGFITEKHIFKTHILFTKWKAEQKNKRGGSRKLVSTLDFDSEFDPDWNISINHDGAKKIPKERILDLRDPRNQF
jgi:hypothetical protein